MRTFPLDGRGRPSPLRRRVGAMVFLVVALLLVAPGWAQYIGSDQLFLAPLDVPEQIYDGIPLAAGDSYTFSAGNVPGATQLLGVHILPLLNPNPATAQGDYSEGALAGVSLGNYSSYYYYQPNVDYNATVITSDATTVTFGQEGQYYVQLVTSDGMTTSNTVFRADVDDDVLDIPSLGVRLPTAASRVIPCPTGDLTIISQVARRDRALESAMRQYPGAAKAPNIAALCQALQDKFNANGMQKFSLTIIGHGAPGRIEIGNQIVGVGGAMTAAQFQQCLDPYVSSVQFYSCSLGAGAAGNRFGQAIGASIKGGVTLFDRTVTLGANRVWDIDARGRAHNFSLDVPEPGPVLTALAFFGGLGLTLLRARRSRA